MGEQHGYPLLAGMALFYQALAAAGRGFEAAYSSAAAISPPGTLDYAPRALWVMFDLLEAAARTSRHDAAHAHVKAILDTDAATLSPRLAMLAAGTAALLDDGTNHTFERALAVPDADRWPRSR